MKLSLLNIENTKLLRDAEFNWLGLTAEEYQGKKHLTFLNDEKYLDEVLNNKTISAIITTKMIANKLKNFNYGLLISDNPRKDFFELHNSLAPKGYYFKKAENKISNKAKISKDIVIGEYNIIIEDDVIIEDNVTIYENVIIKKGSIIRSGSRIGGNGFEFSKVGNMILKIQSVGKVIIHENVEIQNNTCIDKGVFSDTIIFQNVKIDNNVQISHDVKIGENTFVVGGTFIGGRTKIGKNSYLGPNCTVKNGLILGENSKVSMGAVVTQNVKNNETVTGNFAIEHRKFLKLFKYILKLVN